MFTMAPSSAWLNSQDETATDLKLEVCTWRYGDMIQLVAVCFYVGETTSLRTQGGGSASVFVVSALPETA